MKFYISLGYNCTPARYFQDRNLRKLAMPFDWTVCTIDSAIHMFETDFTDWLNEDNLVFLEVGSAKFLDGDGDNFIEVHKASVVPVIDKKHGIQYPHDFIKDAAVEMSSVKEKYSRRINRMFDLFSSQDNSFVFVATDGAPGPWLQEQYDNADVRFKNNFAGWKERFSEVIDNKYPKLKYELYNINEVKRK